MLKEYGTFLGKPVGQTPFYIYMWEKILRNIDFKRIIDFGTSYGGTALYFYLFCLERDVEFYTYDIVDWKPFDKNSSLKSKVSFDEHFFKKDIFDQKNIEEIKNLIQKEGLTIIIISDNGNKRKEFEIFFPFLKIGDIFAAHDWLSENDYSTTDKYKDNSEEIFVQESEEDSKLSGYGNIQTKLFMKTK